MPGPQKKMTFWGDITTAKETTERECKHKKEMMELFKKLFLLVLSSACFSLAAFIWYKSKSPHLVIPFAFGVFFFLLTLKSLENAFCDFFIIIEEEFYVWGLFTATFVVAGFFYTGAFYLLLLPLARILTFKQ